MTSVFNQTYRPVEILVMDDGSTDNTRELMKGYGDKVRYFQQENQGVATARMNACRLAKGEFIAFQDDDDLMPNDRINNLYQALIQFPSAVLAVGDWVTIDKDGQPTGKRWLPEGTLSNSSPVLIENGFEAILWPKVPAVPHTTLFRKNDGEKINWFDTRFRHAAEDKDFFARLAKLGPIVYIPQIVSFYRRGHKALTKQIIIRESQKILLFEKHLKTLRKDQKRLIKRMRYRVMLSLLKIEREKYTGRTLDEFSVQDCLKRGMPLLRIKERVIYYWTKMLKYPAYNFIKSFRKDKQIVNL